MADRTQSSVDIAADPGQVLDVIAAFEAYPEWADQVKECHVLSEDGDGWADQVEFVLDAGAIKDQYTLEYDWAVGEDGSGVISWHLVRANLLKGLTGSYTLEEVPAGTRVTYDLEVDLTMPMIGMLKRKAEKHIITTALTELKKRVEG
ncbi:SRPBCC family protein [Phycicoccus sp. BSK3Z-2]|uniref:SRPBCC family protein n=1 Tax=Phycicoccus avicenniae TaxID=2828860 RepID=A0A941D968_9MICO|nr:SRPBCC family protein [Phycicoccus avicenniae]MBR7743145.1 SRPBCC family protein [Phycicoccus avicenniae]